MIELEAGDVVVGVSPALGGRLTSIAIGGTEVLVTGDGASDPLSWGSYPMVPWAGRIGWGRFRFGDLEYRVPQNFGDHAVHGTGFVTAWETLDQGFDYVDLRCRLDWAFGGSAHQHIQLLPDALVCVLSVVADHEPMPASIGWHPWFLKPVDDRLRFDAMYRRNSDHLPDGHLVEPPDRPWDDCFVGPARPLLLHYPTLTLGIDSDCDHWVVYDERAHATCVEPQSAPPDAFNLVSDDFDRSTTVLAPGEMLQRTMTIRWDRTPRT